MFGGEPDRIPLTIYEMLFPRGMREREIRDLGVGLIHRPPAHIVEHREVEIESREYWDQGRMLIRRTIHTPVGDVWQTLEPDVNAYETSAWIKDHFIKRPDDYKAMEFYIRDAAYHHNYGHIRELQRRTGGDGLVYVRIAKSPMQEMLYQMMGLERFSLDYYDRRDLFDSLHNTMLERYKQLYDLAADSPVEIVLFGDNITSDVVGTERYRKYLMPVYADISARLNGTGKTLAVHIDGNVESLKHDVAESKFDIVEALTPPPMGDFSIADARKFWPDKSLWINFTSSMHIAEPEVIESHMRLLLDEAGSKKGFAVGITEDAPIKALERSLPIIAKVINTW